MDVLNLETGHYCKEAMQLSCYVRSSHGNRSITFLSNQNMLNYQEEMVFRVKMSPSLHQNCIFMCKQNTRHVVILEMLWGTLVNLSHKVILTFKDRVLISSA